MRYVHQHNLGNVKDQIQSNHFSFAILRWSFSQNFSFVILGCIFERNFCLRHTAANQCRQQRYWRWCVTVLRSMIKRVFTGTNNKQTVTPSFWAILHFTAHLIHSCVKMFCSNSEQRKYFFSLLETIVPVLDSNIFVKKLIWNEIFNDQYSTAAVH